MINLRRKMLEKQTQQLNQTMMSPLRAVQIQKESSPRMAG
jgi:hypothetical protein